MRTVLVISLYGRPGQHALLRRYREQAARAMARCGGTLDRVIRPAATASSAASPTEIHVVSFPDAASYRRYCDGAATTSQEALLEAAVERVDVVEGEEGPISNEASAEQGPVPGWPAMDPEGLPVRFTDTERRPRPDEREPVLEGPTVRLEPLQERHVDGLCAVGLDPALSRFSPSPLLTRQQMEAYVRDALAARAAGTAIPFATVLREGTPGGQVVGSTRFLNIDSAHRRMEIGATWIGTAWQRTRVNTEAKLLMLRYAFDVLSCIRVELKTDSLNQRSRTAIARLGARQEGVFRNHVITAEGRIRHSVYFAITREDWPQVQEDLLARLDARK